MTRSRAGRRRPGRCTPCRAAPEQLKEPQGPADYQEAGTGTVSFYDFEGNRIETKRFARMPESGKKAVTDWIAHE